VRGRLPGAGAFERAAGAAVGADGLLIEVHAHPEDALSDGAQSLRPARFGALLADLQRLTAALDRDLDLAPAVPARAGGSLALVGGPEAAA